MTLKLIIRPPAQDDIDALTIFFGGAGNRFLDDLNHVLDRLTTFPHFGPLHRITNPELAGLRSRPLHRFPVTVYYIPTATIIDVIRVLHQSRDRDQLLSNT